MFLRPSVHAIGASLTLLATIAEDPYAERPRSFVGPLAVCVTVAPKKCYVQELFRPLRPETTLGAVVRKASELVAFIAHVQSCKAVTLV